MPGFFRRLNGLTASVPLNGDSNDSGVVRLAS